MLDWNVVFMQEMAIWELARQRRHESTKWRDKGSAGRQIPSFVKALPFLPILMLIGGAHVKLHG